MMKDTTIENLQRSVLHKAYEGLNDEKKEEKSPS